MKIFKLILFLTLIFISSSSIIARARYNGVVERGGLIIKSSPTQSYITMQTFPGATVTVYLTGTLTLASIYSDNSGTPKSNSFFADSTNASYFFYINNGIYDIKFSGIGIASPFTKAGINIFDSSSIASGFCAGATDITNFGADSTGTVSSRTAIVTAYATARTTTKKVCMPQGIYLLTAADFNLTGHQTYIIDPNIEWYGAGIDKTIIKIEENITPSNDPTIMYISGDNPDIHDFTIFGATNINGTDSPVGVGLRNVKRGYIHRVKVTNLNNNIAAGGGAAGAIAFDYTSANANSYDELSTTTLGTNISAGLRTVTPANMLNISPGRRLKISGTTEYVVVISITQTTFTFIAVNSHNSTDIVTALGEGQDTTTFEENEVSNCFNCSAFVVTAQSGRFIKNRMINGGNNINNGGHAFYVQMGGNLFEGNYIEYFGIPSIQEYPGGTGTRDVTANRWIGNDIISTRHFFTGGTPQINDGGIIKSLPVNYSLMRQQIFIGNHFRTPWKAALSGALEIGPRVIFSNNYLENSYIQQSSGDALTEASITGNTFLGIEMVPTPWAVLARDNSIIANNKFININTTNNIGSEAPISVGSFSDVHNNLIIGGNYAYAIFAAGTTATKIHDNTITNASSGAILSPKALSIRNGIGLEIYNNFINGNNVISVLDDFSLGGINPGTIKFHDNTLKNFVLDSGRIILHGSVTTWGTGLDFYDNDISQLASLERNSKKLWPAGRNPSVDVNQNELVGIDSNNRLTNILTTDTRFFGIYVGPQQSMGVANDDILQFAVYESGAEFTLKTDGTWTRGNIGIISTASAKKIHDTTTNIPPTYPASYVLFLDSGIGAGNAKVRIIKGY